MGNRWQLLRGILGGLLGWRSPSGSSLCWNYCIIASYELYFPFVADFDIFCCNNVMKDTCDDTFVICRLVCATIPRAHMRLLYSNLSLNLGVT